MADDVSRQNIDWEAIEHTPEFQELIRKRRSFVLPGTIFFLSYYMAFILLAGYAPDFMGSSVYEGLTVGYVLALTQFVMVFTLGILYLKRSERVFDPLSDAAIARYVDQDPEPARGGRFDREGHADGRTSTTGTDTGTGAVKA
jgi:uncharacterized membrane protein (DUF485 family)